MASSVDVPETTLSTNSTAALKSAVTAYVALASDTFSPLFIIAIRKAFPYIRFIESPSISEYDTVTASVPSPDGYTEMILPSVKVTRGSP